MSLGKTFFLDIFNQLLKVNEDKIIIIFDSDGEVWFSLIKLKTLFSILFCPFALRDVYKVLGYNNINTGNRKYYVNLCQCPRGHSLSVLKAV